MWGQNWGSLIWGRSSAAVPALSLGAAVLLGALLLVVGYRLGRRQRLPRAALWTIGVLVLVLPVAIVRATTFAVPFTFANGTVADANQVNQNFSTIAAEIDRLRKPVSVIAPCEFRPPTLPTAWDCFFGQGGSYITDGNSQLLVAPVHVPQGATITSVEVWVMDASSTTNVQICVQGPLDNIGSAAAGPCASSSGTPGFTKLTLNTNLVQGNGQAWEIRAFSQDGGGNPINWPVPGFNMTVRNAYVHYEIP